MIIRSDRNPIRGAGLAAALLFSLAAAPARAQEEVKPAATQTATADLPSVDDLLANYVKAIGGRKALEEKQGVTIEGRMLIPSQNITGPITIKAAPPQFLLVRVYIEGMGEILEGYDGKVGWSLSPMMGAMVHEGDILEQTRLQADFRPDLNYRKNYKTLEVASVSDLKGTPCYVLKLETAWGAPSEEYFDTKTWLKIGATGEMESPMGPMEVKSRFLDYKDFDGVKMATKIVMDQMGVERELIVDKLAWGAHEKSTFELPDAIKELLKRDDDEEKSPETKPATTGASGGSGG